MEKSQELVPVERTVIDTQARIVAFLEHAEKGGRLVGCSRATPVGTDRFAVKVRTLEPRRPAPRRKAKPSVAGEMGKALAFVGVLALGLILAGVALYFALRNAFDAAAVAQVGGGLAVGAILLLILGNRVNHSGACPGIAVHCKGCKHS
jgi:hypothetical protein